jgi:hypothetical protein
MASFKQGGRRTQLVPIPEPFRHNSGRSEFALTARSTTDSLNRRFRDAIGTLLQSDHAAHHDSLPDVFLRRRFPKRRIEPSHARRDFMRIRTPRATRIFACCLLDRSLRRLRSCPGPRTRQAARGHTRAARPGLRPSPHPIGGRIRRRRRSHARRQIRLRAAGHRRASSKAFAPSPLRSNTSRRPTTTSSADPASPRPT